MAGTALLEDEPLALVRTDGDDVYVERSRDAHGAFSIEEPWHDERRRARLSFSPWPARWQSPEEATETCSS